MEIKQFEAVLQFWFPHLPNGDRAARVRQMDWWFRGGGEAEIIERFSSLLDQAIRGELDSWSQEPRSCLALIVVLDQFSRAIFKRTSKAFTQDKKACALTLEGIEVGHYANLKTPWEKTFFLLPLGHSENLNNLKLAVKLADDLVPKAPPEDRALLEFSAAQTRRYLEAIVRFGRHPYQNQVLGRESTLKELKFLERAQVLHPHSVLQNLQQLVSSP